MNPNTHLDPVLPLVNSLRSDNDRPISSSFDSNIFLVPASNIDAPHNIASQFETTVKRLSDVNMSKIETFGIDHTISDSSDDLANFQFFQSLLSHPDPGRKDYFESLPGSEISFWRRPQEHGQFFLSFGLRKIFREYLHSFIFSSGY